MAIKVGEEEIKPFLDLNVLLFIIRVRIRVGVAVRLLSNTLLLGKCPVVMQVT